MVIPIFSENPATQDPERDRNIPPAPALPGLPTKSVFNFRKGGTGAVHFTSLGILKDKFCSKVKKFYSMLDSLINKMRLGRGVLIKDAII